MQLISYYLSLFVIVCMFTTLQDFIAAWVGTEYLLDTKTLVFICLNFYFSICVMPLWSYREACGIYMKTKYIMSISAILNLVFSLVFFKYLGLAGIIAASTVSRCLTYFWYEPKILYKDIFSKPVRTYFIYFILNAVFAIIFCAALSITHSFIFKTISLQYFIVKNLVNFFVVTFFYYLLTFKTREFKMIKTKIVFRKRG